MPEGHEEWIELISVSMVKQEQIWFGILKNRKLTLFNLLNTSLKKEIGFTSPPIAILNKRFVVCLFNCPNPQLISPFEIGQTYRKFEISAHKNSIVGKLDRLGFFRTISDAGSNTAVRHLASKRIVHPARATLKSAMQYLSSVINDDSINDSFAVENSVEMAVFDYPGEYAQRFDEVDKGGGE